jgi:RNA polymerase sigma-70 factor (sigma-E family)
VDSDTEKEITAFVTGRAPALLRTAYALCGDRHAAEDLVQNALVKAASRWSRIRGEPENYVRSVLYREFLSGWRRMRRRPETVMADVPERAARDDHADATAERLALRELIRTLPPRQRAVIVLRYLEDVSVDEVAAILGCSRGTVGSQTARALAHLRRSSGAIPTDRADGERPSRIAAGEVTP